MDDDDISIGPLLAYRVMGQALDDALSVIFSRYYSPSQLVTQSDSILSPSYWAEPVLGPRYIAPITTSGTGETMSETQTEINIDGLDPHVVGFLEDPTATTRPGGGVTTPLSEALPITELVHGLMDTGEERPPALISTSGGYDYLVGVVNVRGAATVCIGPMTSGCHLSRGAFMAGAFGPSRNSICHAVVHLYDLVCRQRQIIEALLNAGPGN